MNNDYFYHCFPRRKKSGNEISQGLKILDAIISKGLLLTPEIVKWKDVKIDTPDSEEYVQIGNRLCFTELDESELPDHCNRFGRFALSFTARDICDFGSMPIFYIPRMSEYENYGLGPAFVTQLCHVQELVERIQFFEKLGDSIVSSNPNAPLYWRYLDTGDVVVYAFGCDNVLTMPKAIVDKCLKKSGFVLPEILKAGAPMGLTALGLHNILAILFWGLHDSGVLLGSIKGYSSIFYPTERTKDPLLTYYRQREWRLIGGVVKGVESLTAKVDNELRNMLLDIDIEFFGKDIDHPRGKRPFLEMCEVFTTFRGNRVIERINTVYCPNEVCQLVAERFQKAGLNAKVIGHNW